MHIYFGHTGVHLLPFIECWDKPCIVSFHGADVMLKADSPDYAAKLRRVFHAVPLVLARSRSLEQRLVQLGCPLEKIRINRTGIPLEQFPARRREAPQQGPWRFLQACRLIPKKGLTTCLRAFALFRQENPNAELFIAGKGPLQPILESLAAQLNVSDYVHFTGFLSQPDLLELYHRCHIFLHPSEMPRTKIRRESQLNLEAMATGMPVLATRHGGFPRRSKMDAAGAGGERDYRALAAEMKKITRTSIPLRDGVLASESVAANFEQSAPHRSLEVNIAKRGDRAGSRELRSPSVGARAAFQQEACAVK
jgi:glycosyltransferase involved in cell wall biosynthesis